VTLAARRTSRLGIVFAWMVFALGWAKGAESPNIILILTDDQAWNGTSAAMHPDYPHSASDYYETPNIERLAHGGMRFTDAYSPAPICTPTRRSIQYGMTPARQKGSRFQSPFQPEKHVSIPQLLKRVDSRYRAGHFGKWGHHMGIDPSDAGYDASDGPTDNWVGGMKFGRPMTTQLFRVNEDPKRSFSLTRRAVDFMERAEGADRPFFLQVSYYAVHNDMETRMATWEKYRRKPWGDYHKVDAFAAMTEDMDTAIGRILDQVDALGISGETYIFFTSDNGGVPGETARNHPLRAGKGSLFEGGLRVPLVVAGPGIEAGSFETTPVVGWDLYATFADLAGGKRDFGDAIDSVSFAPLLFGDAPDGALENRSLVFHAPFHPKYKMSALRRGDSKFVRFWDRGERALYDLERDIGEHRDLADAMPERARRLENAMMDYLRTVGARLPKQ